MTETARLVATKLVRVASESFPIRGSFTISRGSKREAVVVVAELEATLADGRTVRGWGECVPYARYGESVDGVVAAIGAQAAAVAAGLDRPGLQQAMPPGAARNALDCAFWDLEAKAAGHPAWRPAGLSRPPSGIVTAFTLSLASPEEMAAAARAASAMPLLKLKLGGDDQDLARVRAVRQSAPGSRLIIDANEAWTMERLAALAPPFAELGVALIEQPLPAGQDSALDGFRSPVPLGADESCHDTGSLSALQGRYQVLNIKLDKTGGLTEALRMERAARAKGFGIMVGCMVATSLSMAPALLLAPNAAFVDLDGPLLLERDRPHGLAYDGAFIRSAEPQLWGA